MGAERFLVTGALGCIGAWTVAALVRQGVPVVALDLGDDRSRLELVMSSQELEAVTSLRGDVTDLPALERILEVHGITHLIHLAALLIPLIKADPPRGALVNVVGTTNVFEAARRHGVTGIAYASSAAAYGPADGPAIDDARSPATLYGVFKLANEQTARAYWRDEGLRTVGLRPYVVYGPGRDTGLTAGPTLAMEAAARGEPFHIGFGGRCQLQYSADAARTFVAAARAAPEGAPVFNLGGPSSRMSEVVAAIEAAAPGAAGRITFDDTQLPFPEALDAGALAATVGYEPSTPLAEGIAATIEVFRSTAVA